MSNGKTVEEVKDEVVKAKEAVHHILRRLELDTGFSVVGVEISTQQQVLGSRYPTQVSNVEIKAVIEAGLTQGQQEE